MLLKALCCRSDPSEMQELEDLQFILKCSAGATFREEIVHNFGMFIALFGHQYMTTYVIIAVTQEF